MKLRRITGWLARFLGGIVLAGSLGEAADLGPEKSPPPPANYDLARSEAQRAIRKFRVAPGFKVELVANEPQLENPVAFHIGNDGKIFVSETGRYRSSALDIRNYMSWYDDDLAARTVEDRVALIKKHAGTNWPSLQLETETVRLLEDRDGDGVAEFSSVFADGFTNILDGIASGVMSKDGWVYFTDIPSVWRLRDTNGDGKADEREQLSYGYGVHFSLTGHDLHGLIKGPDGRIYFSVGDRGAHIRTKEGNLIDLPDEGAAFRMEPDGSKLEVFARGLRNPQELAFNQYGDLFTGENDCDHGDLERWVHIVEGADYGWRIGFQFSEQNPGGVWMSERIWWTNFPGRVAAHLPPLAHIDNGPSGLTYYPGTGLGDAFNDTFFLCHFKGQDSVSGIKMIKQVPRGASYEVRAQPELVWNTLPTDVEFGPDGAIYFSDWVEGWPKSMKGRIYRMVPEEQDPRSAAVKKLLGEGMKQRGTAELAGLLEHADMRVRLEAQWELAGRGEFEALRKTAFESQNQLARLHGIWGVGQLFRSIPAGEQAEQLTKVFPLASDADPEIKGQTLAMLGEAGYVNAFNALREALKDPHPRVRRFAAEGLSQLLRLPMESFRADQSERESIELMLTFNHVNDFVAAAGGDLLLRHRAAVLTADMIRFVRRITPENSTGFFQQWLKVLSAYPDPQGRMAFVLGLRLLNEPGVAEFLDDPDPMIVLEAARAINDTPINDALPALAALLPQVVNQYARSTPLLGLPGDLRKSSGVAEALPAEEYQAVVARPLIRRVLNASFRVGQRANAFQVGTFAGESAQLNGERVPDAVVDEARAEALLMLGQWGEPSPRDKVLGLYRPLESRDAKPAADVLFGQLERILNQQTPVPVRVAALNAVAELDLVTAGSRLGALVGETGTDGRVRASALKALARLQVPEFESALAAAKLDGDPAVRRAAVQVASLTSSGGAAPDLAKVLQEGSLEEKQVALAALAQIPGTLADEIIYRMFRPWIEGEGLDPNLELDVLEASRARQDERFKEYLERYDESVNSGQRNKYHWALHGGDVANGKKVFIEHPAAACYRCHAVEGGGGIVGPKMDGIAGRVTADYLLESIVQPNASIAAGFENQLIEMKDGRFLAGIVSRETATEIVLNSPEDGPVTVSKAEVKSRERGASGMPEGLQDLLTKTELRDLMAYLLSLK